MFKVGDKVKSNRYGEGVVTHISSHDHPYCVEVYFDCGVFSSYNILGRNNFDLIVPEGIVSSGTTTINPELNSSETGIRPSRYNKGKIELWDVFHMLQLDAFQSNVLKYIYRYEDKDGEQDLTKALNYVLKMLSIKSGVEYKELFSMTVEELNNKFKK